MQSFTPFLVPVILAVIKVVCISLMHNYKVITITSMICRTNHVSHSTCFNMSFKSDLNKINQIAKIFLFMCMLSFTSYL